MTALQAVTGVDGRDPAWRPRLVVLDLDGTVVPYGAFDDEPNLRVRAAVRKVLAAGVPVVVATGRAVWHALPTAAALGLNGIQLVCSNGAVVYDGGAGAVRHEVTIDPAQAAWSLAAGFSAAGFAVERGAAGFLYTADFARDFTGNFLAEVPMAELVSERTPRMVCRPVGYTPEEAAAVAAEALAGAPYSWYIGYSSWIDVAAPGVSKASGVALVASDLDIAAADVVAIGDGSNDVELFAWVGHAIAMGQAPASVQAAADAVTASVHEDGVAVALEQWFG